MAIEKKSLISKRIATKKALVAKPQVSSKPGLTRAISVRTKGPITMAKGPITMAKGPITMAKSPLTMVRVD